MKIVRVLNILFNLISHIKDTHKNNILTQTFSWLHCIVYYTTIMYRDGLLTVVQLTSVELTFAPD